MVKGLKKKFGMPHAKAKKIVDAAHRKAFEAQHAPVINALARTLVQPPGGGMPPGGVQPPMPPRPMPPGGFLPPQQPGGT